MKYFAAHTRAQRLGITADILTRDSQGSAGYWEIVQDALADLVRIQLRRCFDKEGHPDLYHYVRGLSGEAVWQVAFLILIILAPAEWLFLSYFLFLLQKEYMRRVVSHHAAYFLSHLHDMGFSIFSYGQSLVHGVGICKED